MKNPKHKRERGHSVRVVFLKLRPIRWTAGGHMPEYLSQANDRSLAAALSGRHGVMTPEERELAIAEQKIRALGFYPAAKVP